VKVPISTARRADTSRVSVVSSAAWSAVVSISETPPSAWVSATRSVATSSSGIPCATMYSCSSSVTRT
jgi:hypothetical protein